MISVRSSALLAALCGLSFASVLAPAQQWGEYGGNAQHTAEATKGVQTMNSILWQTPIDLYPPYDGTDLLIHYGCPIISGGGTVVLAVRNGPNTSFPTTNDTYQIEGHSLSTGATIYTQSTDFTDWMPHDWTPSMTPAIDSNDVLYIPGAGGTIYRRSSANSATATTTQLCFYGLSTYQGDTTDFNNNVQICTPLVVDANNNVYFGFYVSSSFYTSGSNTPGLKCGVAKISSTGVGTWVAIDTITGDSGDEVQTNCEPAISNDGTHLYVASKQALWYNYGNPKLDEINTSDLSKVGTVGLTIPVSTPTDPDAFAYVMDDGTATPMVGPDGDVYYGVWYQNIERGFMLHYSGDLSTQKLAGAFGWDDTAAVVPASIVPSYTGTSSYLILTKYNNYADYGAYGDGQNKVAILDPNASETYTIQYGDNNPGGVMVGDDTSGTTTGASYTTMNEVMTLLGVTTNTAEHLEGFREWCVNTVAVDVPDKSAIVNSEDGNTYRWDFTTNAITDTVDLEPPTGEAYTPTLASNDGIAICVNNATVFALWDGVKPSSMTLSSGASINSGESATGTLNLTGDATGPGATISLTSSDGNLTVPASVSVPKGSSSVTFPVTTAAVSSNDLVTITASRYGFTATLQVTVAAATLSNFYFNGSSVQGGSNANAVVQLNGYAASGGDTISLSGSAPMNPGATTLVGANQYERGFTVATDPVSTNTVGTVNATFGSVTLHASITVTPAVISSVQVSPSSVQGGVSSTGTVTLNGGAGSSGDVVTLSVTGPASVPASVTVASNGTTANFNVTTSAVSVQSSAVISATWNSTTVMTTLTVTPASLSTFTLSASTVIGGTSTSGTITLNGKAGSSGDAVAISGSGPATLTTPETVASGATSVTFSIPTSNVASSTSETITATWNGGTKQATLTVLPSPTITSFTVEANPLNMTGDTLGIVTLNEAVPVSVSVSATSSSPYITVAQPVVAAGAKTATFLIQSQQLPSQQQVAATVKVSLNGSSQSQTVTDVPFGLASLSLSSSTVFPGQSTTLTIYAAHSAGSLPLTVALSSSSTIVSLPATATIPAGESHTSVTIKAVAVASHTPVTITCTLAGSTKTITLIVSKILTAGQ